MINLKIYLLLKHWEKEKKINFAANFSVKSTQIHGIVMKSGKSVSLKILVILISLCPFAGASTLSAQNSKFTLVIDAGHGGHDPGAMGSIIREKDINLAISLELGKIVEQNMNDVNVVYTRKTDKYLTLQERADVVNNNHADLFVCVHTNSAQSSAAYGAETFTLGLAKTKSNLDVAMRENSVILLEDDYKTKYKGFDPNSVDSYIMFEFMQDKYIERSVDFASTIQKQFSNYAHRSDRGVRQAGFWVLHRSACPSVLVEVGFISNPAEEKYLASASGQHEMAAAIYNAIVKFKKDHDKRSGKVIDKRNYKELSASKAEEKEEIKDQKKAEESQKNPTQATDTAVVSSSSEPAKTNTSTNDKAIFKVQILASTKKLKSGSTELKGISDYSYFEENGLYKYTVGAETEYSKIVKVRKDILEKFPEAFIIAFSGNKKISAREAQKLNKQ